MMTTITEAARILRDQWLNEIKKEYELRVDNYKKYNSTDEQLNDFEERLSEAMFEMMKNNILESNRRAFECIESNNTAKGCDILKPYQFKNKKI